MVLHGGGAHLEELGAAHRPIVESALRAAPVVEVGLVEAVESVFVLIAEDAGAAIVTGYGILHREVIGCVDAQPTPVVPDGLHRINQYLGAAEDIYGTGIEAVCGMAKHQPANHEVIAANRGK